jgi:hypothetical protein
MFPRHRPQDHCKNWYDYFLVHRLWRHFSSNILIPKSWRLENISKSCICKHIFRLGYILANSKQSFHYYITPLPQRLWWKQILNPAVKVMTTIILMAMSEPHKDCRLKANARKLLRKFHDRPLLAITCNHPSSTTEPP